ncbi:MAG: SGNH/GDSL hydrolase family protein [Candidatus Omnitrophota bacterium]
MPNPINTEKKQFLQKLVLLLFSIVIGLCLSEYIIGKLNLVPEFIRWPGHNIRFVENPGMVYEYIPGMQRGRIKTNKQGFCDADFSLEKPKGLVRIAMLGDSITQGVFVAPQENFSEKLEALLNKQSRENKSPLRYEVMNFGVVGYNLEAEVETLKEKALPYKPDIVVLNMFFNDNEPIPGLDPMFISCYDGLSERQQSYVIKRYIYNRNSLIRRFERDVLFRSKLYLFLISSFHNARRDREALLKVYGLHDGAYGDMKSIYRGFEEIDKLKKQYGFDFLICIHTSFFRESENDFKFASIAQSYGFNYFYMSSYYKKENIPPQDLQLKGHSNDDCHPNELGHSIIAGAMFDELKKYNFIDLG